MEIDQQLERLNKVRSTIEELNQMRSRLIGELSGYKKSLIEIEEECRQKFEIEIDELPDMIDNLEKEAEKSISKAEHLLKIEL